MLTDRDTSKLRIAIWGIINDLNPYRPEVARTIELRTHFSPDYQRFLEQVAEQKIRASVYLPYLDRAVKLLESDEMRRLRRDEPEPRWRANYDLILGQLMAYKVRVYEYLAYLDHFAKNPKRVPLHKPPDLKLEHWGIRTRGEMLTRDVTAEYLDQANELLAQCAENHPGTPWAARADWERRRGYGVTLKPVYWHTWRRGGQPAERIPIPKL